MIGFLGVILFIATGPNSIIPWVASGPFALVFLGLVVAEFREYFQTLEPKPQPKSPPKSVYQNQEPLTGEPKPKDDVPTFSSTRAVHQEAVVIEGKSFKKYRVSLVSGQELTAKAGADDWIRVELVSLIESAKLEADKKYDWERGKEGKNLTIEYYAERNGTWFVYIFNLVKTPLEVGVSLFVRD